MKVILGLNLVFFSGVKVVAFAVDDHCLEMELWAGGVASALPENLMSAMRMGWKLWHAQILGKLSPEKCLWCCPSRAAAVGCGSSSLCDELLMGCGNRARLNITRKSISQ